MPRVSVIIPAYQRAHTLIPVLERVFAQTYTDYEIVIADDGSTDETQTILAPYRERIVYDYAENRGASSARNRGARQAQGEFLAFLDSDDFWLPRKLELQMALFDAHPEVGWVYCDRRYLGQANAPPERVFVHNKPHRGWILKQLFLQHSPIQTSTLVVRKKLFEESGGFDESLRVFEDHDLYFRLAPRAPADFVDELLVECSRENRQPKAKPNTSQLESRLLFKRRAIQNNPRLTAQFSKEEFRQGYVSDINELAIAYAEEKSIEKSRALLEECTKLDPTWLKPRIYRWSLAFPNFFVKSRGILAKVKRLLVSK